MWRISVPEIAKKLCMGYSSGQFFQYGAPGYMGSFALSFAAMTDNFKIFKVLFDKCEEYKLIIRTDYMGSCSAHALRSCSLAGRNIEHFEYMYISKRAFELSSFRQKQFV